MILVDMSNLAISALQSAFAGNNKNNIVLDEQNIRHIILKKLIDVHKKIGRHHELILCFDSRNYWRKDFFPLYKGTRVRSETDTFPWEKFYQLYNEFKLELPLYFNYKCIEIPRVEGDDIIFCISEYHKGKDIVIASSDTDDLQILEKYPEAAQFSLKTHKFITCEQYKYTLLDHIIEGDKSDGIPSIIAAADTYMDKDKRAPSLTKQIRAKLKFIIPDEFKARYEENKKIIDMSQIPSEYRDLIIAEYLKDKPKRTGNAFKYCLKYKLGQLLKLMN